MKKTVNNSQFNKRSTYARSIEENLNLVLQPLFSGSKKEFILINNFNKIKLNNLN